MRIFGTLIGGLLLGAVTAAAQTPQIITLPPRDTPGGLGARTLTPQTVACTDLPTSAPPSSPLRIVAAHAGTNHQIFNLGEIVVLNGGTPQGLMVGQRYFVRRLQFGLYGEPTSIISRGAIRTAGWLTVVAADEHSALARIDYECDAITAGDYLDPFVEPSLPPVIAADGPPDFANLGKILFGADRRQNFGAGDVLTIDRGSAHGIALGSRVAFYRDRLNGTPLVEMGAGVVVELFADTAKVVVVRSRDAVTMGDYFAVRGSAP